MKRLFCILLILCLACSLSAAAQAAQFANAYTLLQDWETNGYPDDVGSIYSTDGTPYNLTVQLVGDDFEARAEEIRAMLDDPSTISFEKGTYTDKQLHEISSEIADAYVKEGTGVQSVGVGWGTNGGFGASGKEMRVVVRADEAKAIALAQELGQKYGEAVIVEVARGDLAPTEEAEPAEAEDNQLISPAPAQDEADAAEEDAAASEPEAKEKKISEDTLYTVLAIVLGAFAAFLIIFLRRKKRKMR